MKVATLSLLIAAALALSACATTQRTITVPCVAPDQAIPAEPERVKGRLTGNAERDVQIIAGSALRLRAWGQSLRDIVEGCRQP